MTLNAAAESARLSVTPMMDGGDFELLSIGYWALCARCVHASIAQYRAYSC